VCNNKANLYKNLQEIGSKKINKLAKTSQKRLKDIKGKEYKERNTMRPQKI